MRVGLEIGLGAVGAQLVAGGRADRDEPRAGERAARGGEEAHRGRGREEHVVGGRRRVARVVVERLGDGLVQRDDVDVRAARAQRVGQHVAALGRAGDQRTLDGDVGERLDQALGDRALGHDVGLDAARAQRPGRAGPDRRDGAPRRARGRRAGGRAAGRRRWATSRTRGRSRGPAERRVERLDPDRRRLDHRRAECAQPRRERARLRPRACDRDRAAVERALLQPREVVTEARRRRRRA